VPSPLLLPSLVAGSHPSPPPLPPPVGAVRAGVKMLGVGSANGWSWVHYTTCLTATPSAASMTLPPPCSVTSHLLELYRECVDNSGCVRLMCKARSGLKKLTFFLKLPSATPVVPPPHPHWKFSASARRREHDRRRREAWLERRKNQPLPPVASPPATAVECPAGAGPAPAALVSLTAAANPAPQLSYHSNPPASQPGKRAKTISNTETTRASS
jgi:hypothetical protein